MPPRRSTARRLLPLWIVLGVLAFGMVACSVVLAVAVGKGAHDAVTAVSSASPGSLFQHPEDVSIDACPADLSGTLDATVTVVNHSSKLSNYSVQISFTSADGAVRYGDGYAIINGLAAGQRSTQQVSAFTRPPAGASFVCRVLSAQRTVAS